ncbi:polysaccharide deacetylase family protein [Proteobacteria bacterium 005FR1]|nr:polysaccharide deacetylase family protein [Proteobacteria bacterium 005FR1]
MFIPKLLGLSPSLLLLSLSCAAAHAAVVLQYHHVSENSPPATSVSPALFREHMEHLHESGYRVVRLDELAQTLKSGKPLPDKTVAITFDDGYLSIYEVAFPILKDYGWPFTVFVNTRPHDQGLHQFASWDQLREMAGAGATIANHSYSHPHMLRRQTGESDRKWRERMREEILRAERTIDREIGKGPRLFAYPYGEYDGATQALLADLGYIGFGQQSGPLGPLGNHQALPRFPFGGPYGSIQDFRTKVASLPMPLRETVVYGSKKQVLKEPLLPTDEDRPRLVLALQDEKIAPQVQCFASGQGAIPTRAEGATVIAQPEKPLGVGRSRYNCTAPSGQAGRFYWYSQQFIRKQPDGEWYPEA